jgi:flagellar hook-length control protein FliK
VDNRNALELGLQGKSTSHSAGVPSAQILTVHAAPTGGNANEGQSDTGQNGGQPPQSDSHSDTPTLTGTNIQAARQNAENALNVPASTLNTPTGLTAERAQIMEQVTRHLEMMRLTNGRGEMTLRLQPETLGSLHVTIASHADGVVARIVAQTEQVQHVMQTAKDELRTALENRGLRLHDLDVSVGQGAVSDGRTAFGSAYQTPQEQAERAYARSYAPASTANETVEAAPIPALAAQNGLNGNSRLDYRA